MLSLSLALLTLLLVQAGGINPYNVPPAVGNCLAKEPALIVRTASNPFYVTGDFNGDGELDYAVLVARRADSKSGLLVCHAGAQDTVLLWAGRKFIWNDEMPFDGWYVLSRSQARKIVGASARGDVLFLSRGEASNGILYWTPTGYSWKQLDD